MPASVSPRLTVCCTDFVDGDLVDFGFVTFDIAPEFVSESVSEVAFDAFAVLGTEFFAESSGAGAALVSAATALSLRTPA